MKVKISMYKFCVETQISYNNGQSLKGEKSQRSQLSAKPVNCWHAWVCHMNTPHVHPASGISPPSCHPVRPFLSGSCLISHLGSLYSDQKQCEKCLKSTTEGWEKIITSYLAWHHPESLSEALPQAGVEGLRTQSPRAGQVVPGDFCRGGISVAIPEGGGQAVPEWRGGLHDLTELGLTDQWWCFHIHSGGLRSWT